MSESEQATSSSGSSNQQLSAVSLKILPFWSNDPALWFSQIESQFPLKNISSLLLKFHYIVSSLEPQIALHVLYVINSGPASRDVEAVNFLWKRKHFDERGWKRKRKC